MIKVPGWSARQTAEVPEIIAELASSEDASKIVFKMVLLNIFPNSSIFVDDTINLVELFDGRASVVEAIMQESRWRQNGFGVAQPNFEVKTNILVRGAWSG